MDSTNTVHRPSCWACIRRIHLTACVLNRYSWRVDAQIESLSTKWPSVLHIDNAASLTIGGLLAQNSWVKLYDACLIAKSNPAEGHRHLRHVKNASAPRVKCQQPLAERVAGAMRGWPSCSFCHAYFAPGQIRHAFFARQAYYDYLNGDRKGATHDPAAVRMFCSDWCVRASYYTQPAFFLTAFKCCLSHHTAVL